MTENVILVPPNRVEHFEDKWYASSFFADAIDYPASIGENDLVDKVAQKRQLPVASMSAKEYKSVSREQSSNKSIKYRREMNIAGVESRIRFEEKRETEGNEVALLPTLSFFISFDTPLNWFAVL